MRKHSQLEIKTKKRKKRLKNLDLLFVPSSFVRDFMKWERKVNNKKYSSEEKEEKEKSMVYLGHFFALGLELIRLQTYYSFLDNLYDRFF